MDFQNGTGNGSWRAEVDAVGDDIEQKVRLAFTQVATMFCENIAKGLFDVAAMTNQCITDASCDVPSSL